jgi:Zn-dependent peptidase ImmA (M78 family)/predicted secreted protein
VRLDVRPHRVEQQKNEFEGNALKSPLELARRDGARAAQRLYWGVVDAGSRRVDVFRLIESAGIWLMFQPLGNLYGAYQREDGTRGIIINSKHPLILQRFTAAHELGHHELGHEDSVDTELEIEDFASTSIGPQEAAAQSFAADLLMPLELVNAGLRRLGLSIKATTLSGDQVYQLALELGVSYRAMIFRLVGLRRLSVEAGRMLRRERPIDIKIERSHRRLEHHRNQVWVLDGSGREQTIEPWVGDEIHVVLAEIPSSGYVWLIDNGAVAPKSPNLTLEDEAFEGHSQRPGATGQHRFIFKVQRPGEYQIRLRKDRPWRADSAPAATFEARVAAEAFPTGDDRIGLLDRQKDLLLVS